MGSALLLMFFSVLEILSDLFKCKPSLSHFLESYFKDNLPELVVVTFVVRMKENLSLIGQSRSHDNIFTSHDILFTFLKVPLF